VRSSDPSSRRMTKSITRPTFVGDRMRQKNKRSPEEHNSEVERIERQDQPSSKSSNEERRARVWPDPVCSVQLL